jgi:hypothetical protein
MSQLLNKNFFEAARVELVKEPKFIFGLLLKLLLLPFAFHSDLVSMYWRANLMASHGLWGYQPSQVVGHWIYALNLKLMQLLGFDLAAIFHQPFGITPGKPTASTGDWLQFANLDNINAVLFMFKLPHLIFDVLVYLVLARKFKNHPRRSLILASWWLNPVNLYAFYIFARHDSITSFFMLLAVLLLANKKIVQAVFSLFLAIKTRAVPILLAPVLGVAALKEQLKLKDLLIKGLVSVLLVLGLSLVLENLPLNEQRLDRLLNRPPAIGQTQLKENEPFLIAKISSLAGISLSSTHPQRVLGVSWAGIPVFPVLFLVLLIIQLLQPKENNNLTYIARYSLAAFSLFFILSPLSPHYFVWLSIFITLVLALDYRYLWIYAEAVLWWLLWALWRNDLTMFSIRLFLPISQNIYYLPQFFSSSLLTQVFKVLFSLSMLELTVFALFPHWLNVLPIKIKYTFKARKKRRPDE